MATTVVFDDIVSSLRAHDIKFGIGDGPFVRMAVKGDNGVYPATVLYIQEKEIIVVYAEYSFRIPEDKRDEALALAARTTWGLLFGACEFEAESGGVRFRTMMLTDDAAFHEAQFLTALSTALSLADRYADRWKHLAGIAVDDETATDGDTGDAATIAPADDVPADDGGTA